MSNNSFDGSNIIRNFPPKNIIFISVLSTTTIPNLSWKNVYFNTCPSGHQNYVIWVCLVISLIFGWDTIQRIFELNISKNFGCDISQISGWDLSSLILDCDISLIFGCIISLILGWNIISWMFYCGMFDCDISLTFTWDIISLILDRAIYLLAMTSL